MILAVQLKKYILGTSIFSIIMHKLSYWQEFYLAILLKVEQNIEIYFYCTILIFDLFIGLKVKSNKQLMLDFKKITE